MLVNIEEKHYIRLQDNISMDITGFEGEGSLHKSEQISFIRNLHSGGAQQIFP